MFISLVSVPIPCLAAEDETGLKKIVEYDQRTDRLIGFCDKGTGSQHQCNPELEVYVGSDLAKLKEAFQSHVIGGYARVILINPLHKKLPAMVLFLQCTCNRFDSNDVSNQWKRLHEMCEDSGLATALGPIIGVSLNGIEFHYCWNFPTRLTFLLGIIVLFKSEKPYLPTFGVPCL